MLMAKIVKVARGGKKFSIATSGIIMAPVVMKLRAVFLVNLRIGLLPNVVLTENALEKGVCSHMKNKMELF